MRFRMAFGVTAMGASLGSLSEKGGRPADAEIPNCVTKSHEHFHEGGG